MVAPSKLLSCFVTSVISIQFCAVLFFKYVPTKEKSSFPYYWKFSTSSKNFLSKNKSLTLLMATHNQNNQLHLFKVLQSTSWTIDKGAMVLRNIDNYLPADMA
jgi:hypothetical protein